MVKDVMSVTLTIEYDGWCQIISEIAEVLTFSHTTVSQFQFRMETLFKFFLNIQQVDERAYSVFNISLTCGTVLTKFNRYLTEC